jgi:hypothetical protein
MLKIENYCADQDPLDGLGLVGVFSKKGGSTVVEKPVYTPPPAAPAVEEAAMQEEAITPEEEMKRKRDAMKQGTKSLQIPVTTGVESTGTVGTGES